MMPPHAFLAAAATQAEKYRTREARWSVRLKKKAQQLERNAACAERADAAAAADSRLNAHLRDQQSKVLRSMV
jgi:hypothetical protein